MAGFICSTKDKSFFVEQESSRIRAMMAVAGRVPDGTPVSVKEIRRFITIYGEYIDLDDGDMGDSRPIRIAERVNGKTVVYAKEFGLADCRKLQPITP